MSYHLPELTKTYSATINRPWEFAGTTVLGPANLAKSVASDMIVLNSLKLHLLILERTKSHFEMSVTAHVHGVSKH